MTIRTATHADADLVVRTVLAALELPEDGFLHVRDAVLDADTLYSLRNALILEDERHRAAGCAVCYPGAEYGRFLAHTWALAWPGAELPEEPEVADPDTFYVDSLFVVPERRGDGCGRLLLDAARGRARQCGARTVSLLADSAHPRLVGYYGGAGFLRTGRVRAFGHDYVRMERAVE